MGLSDCSGKVKTEFIINPKFTIFSLGFIIIGIIAAICFLLTSGESLDDSLYHDRHAQFIDFFESVVGSGEEHPYGGYQSIYPALTVVFYKIVYFLLQDSIAGDYTNGGDYILRDTDEGMLVFCVLMALSLVFFAYSLVRYTYKYTKDKKKLLLALTLSLLSYPIFLAIDRGNCIVFAAGFTALYLTFCDSDSKKLRYLSYIMLALATGIKIYPVLFGIMSLRAKKADRREIALALVIVLAIFLAPFPLTNGTPLDMIHNIIGFTGMDENHSMLMPLLRIASIVVSLLILAICVKTKRLEDWEILILVNFLWVTIPLSGPSTYNYIFLLMPLMLFLSDTERLSKVHWAYLILFIILLCPIPTLFGVGYMDLRSMRYAVDYMIPVLILAMYLYRTYQSGERSRIRSAC